MQGPAVSGERIRLSRVARAYGEAVSIRYAMPSLHIAAGGSHMECKQTRATAEAPWYVVNVPTGKETKMCQVIERISPEGAVIECFSPRYATQIKPAGEWIDVQKTLLPGYVVVATRQIGVVKRCLRKVPEYARVLSMGESFVPLASEERAWIEAFTYEGDRCVPMSMGVMEGDRVVVVSGPLKGREALIKSVNRHRSIAYVELQICGRIVTTKVGLGIVSPKDGGSTDGGEHGLATA